jgi:hypothetical protein
MRLKLIQAAAAIAVAGVAACASTPPVPPPTVNTTSVQSPNKTETASLLSATARVVSVNYKKRSLRLRGPKGRSFVVDVSPDVINFPQIRAGDNVVVQYYESIAFTLGKPGSTPPAGSVVEGGVAAPPGALPAGVIGQQITETGLVTGIDMNAHTLDLVDPKGGGVHVIHVTDPQRQQAMQAVKVGDTITATFTEALAVSVDRVAPAPKKHAHH